MLRLPCRVVVTIQVNWSSTWCKSSSFSPTPSLTGGGGGKGGEGGGGGGGASSLISVKRVLDLPRRGGKVQ